MSKHLRDRLSGMNQVALLASVVAVSLVAAVVLYAVLESSGIVAFAIPAWNMTAKFGGAAAAFFVILLLLLRNLRSLTGPRLVRVSGNVLDERGNPVEGALVFAHGQDSQTLTSRAGWFELRLEEVQTVSVAATLDGRSVACPFEMDSVQPPIALILPDADRFKRQYANDPLSTDLPTSFEWMGPCPEALSSFLEELVRGRMVLVAGAGLIHLSLDHSGPDIDALRKMMAEAETRVRSSRDDGRDFIQSLVKEDEWRHLPRQTAHAPHSTTYNRIMSFDWERIYSTAYDMGFESLDDSIVSVCTDDELLSAGNAELPSSFLVKLCGDVENPDHIRASDEVLQPWELKKKAYAVYSDIIYYFSNRPLLLVGFEMDDPYLKFIVSLLDDVNREGRQDRVSGNFILTFGLTTQERALFLERHEGHIIPINLELHGRSRHDALNQFLKAARAYCEAKPGERHLVLPEQCRPSRSAHDSTTWRIPVVTTGTQTSKDVVDQQIAGSLCGTRIEVQQFDCHRVMSDAVRKADLRKLVQVSQCVIFVADRASDTLDNVLEETRLMSKSAFTLVLCSAESVLGDVGRTIPYRRFDSADLAFFLRNELFSVISEERLERSEHMLHIGHLNIAVIESWIAVEEFLRHVADASRRMGVWAIIEQLIENGTLENIDRDELAAARKVRNDIEHNGLYPTWHQARRTVTLAKELIRAAKCDHRREIRKMSTFGGRDIQEGMQ